LKTGIGVSNLFVNICASLFSSLKVLFLLVGIFVTFLDMSEIVIVFERLVEASVDRFSYFSVVRLYVEDQCL